MLICKRHQCNSIKIKYLHKLASSLILFTFGKLNNALTLLEGDGMKTKYLIILAAGLIMSGCAVYEMPSSPHDHGGGTTVVIYDRPSIDAYVYIPDAVAEIIADRVQGWEMPSSYRYGSELTNYGWTRDSWNMPCYVKADFNGDGQSDYAYMFSAKEYEYDDWYLTTKLLIVVSDGWGGYELSLELILGTVSAPIGTPVEEYWAIGLLPAGTHTIGTVYNNVTVEKSVTLEDDGIYLTSLDPQERSVFYVDGDQTYEMAWDMGTLAKRKAAQDTERANRVIPLKKVPFSSFIK